ncbi:hypothetical protein, partial [Cytobacillus oceanisediminis]|uniref:hypothetical protein n=1 Tax=Cytobacillus oceanisediminis TaxID=665099 RepID=UPI003736A2FB
PFCARLSSFYAQMMAGSARPLTLYALIPVFLRGYPFCARLSLFYAQTMAGSARPYILYERVPIFHARKTLLWAHSFFFVRILSTYLHKKGWPKSHSFYHPSRYSLLSPLEKVIMDNPLLLRAQLPGRLSAFLLLPQVFCHYTLKE